MTRARSCHRRCRAGRCACGADAAGPWRAAHGHRRSARRRRPDLPPAARAVSCAAARRSTVSRPARADRCTALHALREAIDYRPDTWSGMPSRGWTSTWMAARNRFQPGLGRHHRRHRRDRSRAAVPGLDHARRLYAGRRAGRAQVPGLRHRTLGGVGRQWSAALSGGLSIRARPAPGGRGARQQQPGDRSARHCPPCCASRPCWPRASITSPGCSCMACRCIRTRGCCGVDGDARVQALVWRRETWQGGASGRAAHRLRCRRLRLWPALRNATGRSAGLPLPLRQRCSARICRCATRHPQQSVPGVYLAGDGAGIMGADARRAGRRARRAGAAGGSRHEPPTTRPGAAAIEQRWRASACSAPASSAPSAFRRPGRPGTPDDMVDVPLRGRDGGTVARAAVPEWREDEPPQGADPRRHGPLPGPHVRRGGAAMLAADRGAPLDQVGRLRGQAPIKPIPISPMLFEDGVSAARGGGP